MPFKYEGCTNDPKCSTRKVAVRCDNCRKQHADYMREYSRKNKERVNRAQRSRYHKVIYGLSKAAKLELFESSDGLCALCYEESATTVDHDHSCCPGRKSCGKCVRGALCARCNKGLGYIESMGATSDSIVEYLTTEWQAA